MSITVSEAMQLNHLKALKLVAGKNGLDRKISKIGILDYELVEEGVYGSFAHGDFVLTTFTPIRNDIEAVKQTIKDLINCGVAALAIKNIYIKILPDDIIDYATKKNFPIFIFDQQTYFEDVIEDLMIGMASRSHIKILESKIDVLYKNEIKPSLVEELAFDLNRNFLSEFQVFYLKEKRYINDTDIIKIAELYKRSRHQYEQHSVFKYHEGLLVILSYKDNSSNHISLDLDYIFNFLGLNTSNYYMGCSGIISEIANLHLGVKKSIYAQKACELDHRDKMIYSEIGIYKLLIPHENSIWINRYISEILDPLINYDEGKLIETARTYINCKGDIIKTSELLFQHKNTIRYRIQKMKTLLNTRSDGDFYEQLSIAIKCERLIR